MLLVAELAPSLVAIEDCHALDLVAVELALEVGTEVVEALDRRLAADRVGVALDGDLALGFPV